MAALSSRAELVTRSAGETEELGARLGRLLGPGDVVALSGELGAGKTQLVRGICRGLEVPEDEVASPTFAIVASYAGRLPVHHADFYRLSGEDELHATGFSDLLGAGGVLLVEWAERIPGALPVDHLEVLLEHVEAGPSRRRLTFRARGARATEIVSWLGAVER